MAHNARRAQRMTTLTVVDLIRIYLSGSLASASAAAELGRRGIPLPDKNQPPARPTRTVEVIYGPVPNPPLRDVLRRRNAG